jgi:hypothetical protein
VAAEESAAPSFRRQAAAAQRSDLACERILLCRRSPKLTRYPESGTLRVDVRLLVPSNMTIRGFTN